MAYYDHRDDFCDSAREAHLGLSASGVPHCDEDVWCWTRSRTSAYGRTILSKPLPLLFPTIKLSRLDKDTLEYRLLYTQMLRNRNRVADAVLTACEYAELFLAQK